MGDKAIRRRPKGVDRAEHSYTATLIKIQDPDLVTIKFASNMDTILKFDRHNQNLAYNTRLSYIRTLRYLGEFLNKPFKDADEEDLQDFFNLVKGNGGATLSRRTKDTMAGLLKAFYKWILKTRDDPENIRWYRRDTLHYKRVMPRDLLTPKECESLLQAMIYPRDRCLTKITMEGGFRAGEALGIQIKDLNFNNDYVSVAVEGKTGSREIPLINSVPYLRVWLNHHPFASNPDSFLFVRLRAPEPDEPISQADFQRILKIAARNVGIRKNVYPHLLRHGASTRMSQEYTDQERKLLLGWSNMSRMPGYYSHLCNGNLIDKFKKVNGLDTTNTKPKESEPRTCGRCQTINPPEGIICDKCFYPLTAEGLKKKEEREKRELNILAKSMLKDTVKEEVKALLKEEAKEAIIEEYYKGKK